MINLYINADSSGQLVDANGGRNFIPPTFHLESFQTFAINFSTVALSGLTPVDVSDAASWSAAIDKDWNHATAPMVSVADGDIDSTGSAGGVIKFSVDCDTPAFLAALGTAEKISAWWQISGYDAQQRKIHTYIIPVIAYNAIEVTEPST